ncbi:zinc metalloproteinase nas-6-like [Centruroides sculpturatus]|uniref:zinc metalloproteinase nas-6-like n=1 Tax=Centruroides sculpturatus TaxID=218467 RepID=UPI000C6E5136|nr:zinc metalloproteinase nas-6-like [Centruroides sculpturatus]
MYPVDLPTEALQNPDLFLGDIMGMEDNEMRNAIKPSRRWNSGIVPYTIHRSSENMKYLITKAMNHINNATGGCITFKERQYEPDYIVFINGNGCSSYVGRVKGEQHLSLGEKCKYVGTIVHEIVHALGFYHEQNRSDRDDHLIIYWKNIEDKYVDQFKLLDRNLITIYNDFDPESIMIYGNYAASKDSKSMTMEAKSGVQLLSPFQKSGLSPSDVYRIKRLYECQ